MISMKHQLPMQVLNKPLREGSLVTLNGLESHDPEDDELSFTWIAPAGITLSDIHAIQPTFTVPSIEEATDFIFGLEVSDSEFTSVISYVTIKAEIVTGINDPDDIKQSTLVYPNPSTGEFRVKLPVTNKDGLNYTITNNRGQVLHKGKIFEKETVFNLPLAPGLYLINIEIDGKLINKKIMIQ